MTMIIPVSNGQGGSTMLFIPTATSGSNSKPAQYEGRYKVDGMEVSVTYHTSDKDAVDALESKLKEQGWEEMEASSELGHFGMASLFIVAAVVGFFVTWAFSLFGIMILDTAEIIEGPINPKFALVTRTLVYFWSIFAVFTSTFFTVKGILGLFRNSSKD